MPLKRLKELRIAKKETQEQTANAIGVSRPTYTTYEIGTREPDIGTINKLADHFNVSADYLLGRTNDKHEEVLAAAHLDKDLKDMTPEQRQAVYDFIEFQKKRIDREEDEHKE